MRRIALLVALLTVLALLGTVGAATAAAPADAAGAVRDGTAAELPVVDVTEADEPTDEPTEADEPTGSDELTESDEPTRADERRPSAANRSSVPPRIESVYPSPATDGDDGETVVLSVPASADGDDWRLVDDAGHVARLPNRTVSGTVAVSAEPDAVETSAVAGVESGDVHSVRGRLRLADGGDELALRGPNGSVVDAVAYDRAREGRSYVRTDDGWRWRTPGRTSFEPARSVPDGATAFVLPDAPAVPVRALRDADRRILLGGYTLTSSRVVDALIDAHRRGVAVEVLLDGSPVGGTSRAQVRALNRLTEAGVDVSVLAGTPQRFQTHHPKYAVVDDRALVLTENWKPAGVGGASSRGWGVLLRDDDLAASLADVFHADASSQAARSWAEFRSSVEPVEPEPARGSYPERFAPREVEVEAATLLLAPDNAERELRRLLQSANESIRIQQVSVSGPDDPLLGAALEAARRGVTVEITLDRAWYVEEQNRRLVDDLRRRADREGLPLSVALVDPGQNFAKSHVKGVLVDDRTVVLGSLNWNPTALRENREVLVVLEGEAVAAYYAAVFASDRGSTAPRGTPIGFVAAVVAAWLAFATLVATRIRWC